MKPDEKRLIELFAKLVAFPSESNKPTVNKELFAYIQQYLSDRSLKFNTFDNNGFLSLVTTTQTGKQPRVLLQAHLDVVPAQPEAYVLKEKNGKLYGRGVFDMKFAAACYLQLVEDLANHLNDYDFGIMFTSDEELGGENGVKYLLEQGYGAEVCVLPDGGNEWQIEATCNGGWWIRLGAEGKTAHGSRPWEGENAIDNLTAALEEIRQIFGHQDETHCSLTISQISGGEAINQVPGRAAATLDMRFRNMKHYSNKRPRIEAVAKRRGLSIDTLAEVEPAQEDLQETHIAAFMRTAAEVRGEPIGSCHSLGASDARFFRERQIPTIVIRPGGGGAHSDEEWIDKAELLKFYEALKAYIQIYAKIA